MERLADYRLFFKTLAKWNLNFEEKTQTQIKILTLIAFWKSFCLEGLL